MSIADVTSRISQIQAQLALFTPSSSTSSSEFASALDGVTSTTDVAARSSSAATKGDAVVDEAKRYLGVPYVWGGTDPDSGLDCSGLVQLVYKNLGYDLPRVSYEQAKTGTAVDGLANAQPGDILAFGSPVHHVAIYIGDNQMIEAPRPGKNVQVSSVYETPTAIRRIIPDDTTTSSLSSTGVGRVSSSTPYASLFESAAAKYGVSADLLSAVARQESGYDPNATSSAGAQGLMQLMPATAAGLGVDNPYDPSQAVDGAAKLLRSLLDRFGSTPLALAAYNAGPGAVLRYDGIPPYPETQNYVRSVMSLVEAA